MIVTLEINENNDRRNSFDKNIFNKKKYLFDQRKKIYSNNILLNSMTIENNNVNNNKDKIYENQIVNKNGTNKRNMNKINTNIKKKILDIK